MATLQNDILTEEMPVSNSSLIIGGDSRLGRALTSRLSEDGDLTVVTTRRMDTLADDRVFLDFATFRPEHVPPADVAFLCAGETSLENCHQHPLATRRVNVEGTVELANILLRQGTFVVFLSTNLVFDGGTPHVCADADRRPTTVYGHQKAEAERLLLDLGDRIAVVRLAKVLPRHFPRFRSWRHQLQEGQCVDAFVDLNIAPVPLDFAVELIGRIGKEKLAGIWQASASEQFSYYETAKRLADRCNANQELIHGVSALNYEPLGGVIPEHSTLDTSRLEVELGLNVPEAWSTIDRTLAHTIDRSGDE